MNEYWKGNFVIAHIGFQCCEDDSDTQIQGMIFLTWNQRGCICGDKKSTTIILNILNILNINIYFEDFREIAGAHVRVSESV